MVVVATGLDIPIKLLMPKLISYPILTCGILGLGDLVIPGVFISFVIRFGDYVQAGSVYSLSIIAAYTFSLLLCGSMLWIF